MITGAGHGIGAAVAARLAERQYALVLVDRDGDALHASTTGYRSTQNVLRCLADVRDPRAAGQIYSSALERFGRIDDLLLLAGTIHIGFVAGSTADDQIATIDTNLSGTIRCVTEALPVLARTGIRPRILTTSSAIQSIPFPGYASYIASKAGVRAFTATVRNELLRSSSPVTISCALIGGVDTQIVSRGTTDDSRTLSQRQSRFTQRVARISSARAAELLLVGFDLRKPTIHVGQDARFASILQRVMGQSWRVPERFQPTEVPHD